MRKQQIEQKRPELVPIRAHAPAPAFEFNQMFDRLFHDMARTWSPLSLIRWDGEMPQAMPADIFEADNEIVLKAELPGLRKEDVEITVTDGRVTISGEKKKDENVEEYYCSERPSGSFSRSFTLPENVDLDKASAKLDSGVLELHFPKTE